ncbi:MULTISPECIES: tyrosine-type recombinase/integrase [Pantoea]|uniref:tyrosine-type recombinase/integrase n=1 Tax=Pantoea TaxID=53335 RepID=UPI001AD92269|nr:MULTISPECIES: tyrosine-type recombinase/integrase [Pantoea]
MNLIPVPDTDRRHAPLMLPGGWARAVRLREMAVAAGLDVPRYLLAPEVGQLLSFLPDLKQRTLIDTLWNTGARLNEALALCPGDFFFDSEVPFVRLRTLKQRAPRSRGRPTREAQAVMPFRAIPLTDTAYVSRMRELFATFRMMTRRATPVWDVASQETPRNWIRGAIARAGAQGIRFSVNPVTPHTFRHSFAVHLLMNGIHIKQVQALLGHQRLENTEIYTRIFALDLPADLTFSFPPSAG